MEFWFMIILANIVITCLLLYSKIYIALKYQRDGSNDYIAVDVYIYRRLLAYSMQVPIIQFDEIKNPFLLKSKIETGKGQDETHIKREQPLVKKTMNFYMLNPRRVRRIVRRVRYYTRLYCKVMEKFIHSLHCEELHWKTRCGSEDAAITGIGIGMLWAVKALIITRLENHVIVTNKPIIDVNPIFGHNCFKVDFQCIFSIRLGNVINAVRILYNIKR